MFVNDSTPSIVCVAPCHPPVPERSDAVQAESWEEVLPGDLLVDDEHEVKQSAKTMHDTRMVRRATSQS
jgi:hypothetical protein